MAHYRLATAFFVNTMTFFFTSYVTRNTDTISEIVWEIGNAIQSKVVNKNYFPINLDVFIGLACEEPPFQGNHKYVRPRLSRVKDINGLVLNYKFEYVLILPYSSIGQQDLVALIKRYFIDSLSFFDRIKDFDASPLKQDLLDIVTGYDHEPVYLQIHN